MFLTKVSYLYETFHRILTLAMSTIKNLVLQGKSERDAIYQTPQERVAIDVLKASRLARYGFEPMLGTTVTSHANA